MMRNRSVAAFLAALLTFTWFVLPLAAVLPSACTTVATKQNVLLPTLRLAWPGVQADATAGVHACILAGEITAEAAVSTHKMFAEAGIALDSGDRVAISTIPWVAVNGFAEKGITAQVMNRSIGSGVAASLRERLMRFREAIDEYLREKS